MNIEAVLRDRGARIVSVPMAETLRSTIALMRSERVDAVVVTDRCATEGESVLGLLTRREVIEALADHGVAALSMPVGKLSGGGLRVCDVSEPLPEVIVTMRERAASHVLVMDREQPAGLLDASDILFFWQRVVHPVIAAGASPRALMH